MNRIISIRKGALSCRPLRSKSPLFPRRYSTYNQKQYEAVLYNKLQAQLNPEFLSVADISGGCGSMFAIKILSNQFKGMTTIKQHRLVNEILKEDISQWHGLQLKTGVPKK